MQVSSPLSGLAVGHAWRHHLRFDRRWSASVDLTVHLCHSMDIVSTLCSPAVLATDPSSWQACQAQQHCVGTLSVRGW